MKKNKLLCLVLAMSMLFSIVVPIVAYAAEKTITMYAMDGRTIKVPSSKKDAYLKVGWYDSPIITVYAMDGRTAKIPSSKKAAYLKVGWYDKKSDVTITMYSLDGRKKEVFKGKVAAEKKVGWYDSPIITVYAPDGRTKKIPSSQKNAYFKVGWYNVPVLKIGAADGREKTIPSSKLEAYKKVGWHYISNVKLTVTEKETLSLFPYSTNATYPGNCGQVSAIQQFKYKNAGMGYAYTNKNVLTVVTPEKTFKVTNNKMILGDVIADDSGNIYVIWGIRNSDKKYEPSTMHISKYTPNGQLVKTTGFIPGKEETPFYWGSCSSAIGNGKLIVNYAKISGNVNQSNNVIGVNIADMSPITYNWGNNMRHSFSQKVIWSKLTKDFVFADHGTLDDRGFIITSKNKKKNIFNFYLQANANYNTWITNKSFAQLGGLVETDKGVVLVGASAKSISEAAKKEKQNLFIQIFNPDAKEINEKMFVGGVKRSGKTSDDCKDNNNKPLVDVTDYGVIWLTNYTDGDVVYPHAVVIGDKIAILWNKSNKAINPMDTEAFYTLLSSDGQVIVPPVSLGKNLALNSFEEPVYHNGKVYWASIDHTSHTVKVMSINVPK